MFIIKQSLIFNTLLLAIFFLMGCSEKGDRFTARVGHYELSEDRVRKNSNPTEYVDNWIESRLLALEAEERGLDNTADFYDLMEEIRVRILADSLLWNEFLKAENPTSLEIEAYYNSNPNEFKQVLPEVSFASYRSDDEKVLQDVRKMLAGGAEKSDVLKKYPAVTYAEDTVIDPVSMPAPFSQFASISIGGVLGPAKTGNTLCVFKILDKEPTGGIKPLEEVYSHIAERLFENNKLIIRERLIKELKNKHRPEINDRILQEAEKN